VSAEKKFAVLEFWPALRRARARFPSREVTEKVD
jgi:hypothetical protein